MSVSICFVSLNNYAVLSGDPDVAYVGGATVHRVQYARDPN